MNQGADILNFFHTLTDYDINTLHIPFRRLLDFMLRVSNGRGVWTETRKSIKKKQNYICAKSGKSLGREPHLDHIWPVRDAVTAIVNGEMKITEAHTKLWNNENLRMTTRAENLCKNQHLPRSGGGRPRSSIKVATDWLQIYLLKGSKTAQDIKNSGIEAGFSWATLRRAKDEIGAHAFQARHTWHWRMPITETEIIDRKTQKLKLKLVEKVRSGGSAELTATEVYQLFSNQSQDERDEICLAAGFKVSSKETLRGKPTLVWLS